MTLEETSPSNSTALTPSPALYNHKNCGIYSSHGNALNELLQCPMFLMLHVDPEGLRKGGLARFLCRHLSRAPATLEIYLSHGLAATSVLGPVTRAAASTLRLMQSAAKPEQHDRCTPSILQCLGSRS